MNIFQFITANPTSIGHRSKFDIVIERHFVSGTGLNEAWSTFKQAMKGNVPFEVYAFKIESALLVGPDIRMRNEMSSTKYAAWLNHQFASNPTMLEIGKGPETFDEWFWRDVTARKFVLANEDESIYRRPSIHAFLDVVGQIPARTMEAMTLHDLYNGGKLRSPQSDTLEIDVRRTLGLIFDEHMELEFQDYLSLSLEQMRYHMMELLRSKPNRVYEEQLQN